MRENDDFEAAIYEQNVTAICKNEISEVTVIFECA